MRNAARRAGFLALLTLAIAAPAQAAGPGDTLLISRPAGFAPITANLFAWNASGVLSEQGNPPEQNITGDGRYVVFNSQADGLAPGEDPGFTHVFRKDTLTGALTVIDAGGNGDSTDPDISDDGRYVVFVSRASDLAAADSTHDADVFVKDMQTGAVTLLTPTSVGTDCLSCLQPVISGNGSEVAFATEASLVAGDTNGKSDVYAMPRGGGTPILVSAKPGGTDASAGASFNPSITDNGATVAYLSTGDDLDPTNDTTADFDLYVRALAGTNSSLASAQSGSNVGVGTGGVDGGQISGDGTTVVWSDRASYLVADADSKDDIYRRVLGNNALDTLVSVNTAGTKGDDASFGPAIDATGRRVAFISGASNLGASGSGNDLFVRDTNSATTTAITDGNFIGAPPALTQGSGDRVAFLASAPLSDGPTPAAIHVASVTGTNFSIVSDPPSGPLVPGLTSTRSPDFDNTQRRVSADGRYVVFSSSAPALGGPPNQLECWRRDQLTGDLLLVSTGPSGPIKNCSTPTVSDDGERIAFGTAEPLDPADSGNTGDVYVHDVRTGTNTLVTRANGAAGAPASPAALGDFEISGDGRRVAFVESAANNLGDPSGHTHVYLRDLEADTTTIVDRTTAGTIGPGGAENIGSIGLDETGDHVAFATLDHLDSTVDSDGIPDVYVRDLSAGTTTLVSRQSASDGGAKGTIGSLNAVVSLDGNHVLFTSSAQNLVPSLAPWPGSSGFQLFERDLAAQTTTLVSTSADGTSASDGLASGFFSIDRDGGEVAFDYTSFPTPTNVAPGLSGDTPALVVRRVSTHQNLAVIQPDPLGGGSFSTEGARAPGLSADGRCLSFYSHGRNVFPGMSPDFTQLYMRVLDGTCQTPQPGPVGVKAPKLSRVSMTNKRFRVGKKRTVVVAAAARKRRVKVGTVFRFTLDQSATVTIRIDRLTKGKRVGKRCVAPKPRLHKRKNCVRAVKRGTLTRRSLAVGARRVPFSGRIGKRKLSPGSYRATLTASAAGLKSKPVRLRFTVVR